MRHRFIRTVALCAIGAGAAYTNVVAAPMRQQQRDAEAFRGLYYMFCGKRYPVKNESEYKRIRLAKYEFR